MAKPKKRESAEQFSLRFNRESLTLFQALQRLPTYRRNPTEAAPGEHQALMAAYLGRELAMKRKVRELFKGEKP